MCPLGMEPAGYRSHSRAGLEPALGVKYAILYARSTLKTPLTHNKKARLKQRAFLLQYSEFYDIIPASLRRQGYQNGGGWPSQSLTEGFFPSDLTKGG